MEVERVGMTKEAKKSENFRIGEAVRERPEAGEVRRVRVRAT